MSAVKIFLTEASLGCLMAVLSTADAVPILTWAREKIPADVLAGDGLEACPHVTCAYGFQPSVTEARMRAVLAGWDRRQVRFTLGCVARFADNPAYDVLKVDLAFDDDLQALNAALVAAFGDDLTQTYDYHPHLTLAYVRKGACRELDGHAKLQGNTYVLDRLVFSLPESTSKFSLPLTQEDDA